MWVPALGLVNRTASFWVGKKVRLLTKVRTQGGIVYRKGRTATVTQKRRGLSLKGKNLSVTRCPYFRLAVFLPCTEFPPSMSFGFFIPPEAPLSSK